MTLLLTIATFLVSIIGMMIWLLLGVGVIVLIVRAVDGCQYGGPRFRDWRDPVLTFGGVFIFVAVYAAGTSELLSLIK
jgi:hypothetical protein